MATPKEIREDAEKRLSANATRCWTWVCSKGWYFIIGGAGLFVALLVWVF